MQEEDPTLHSLDGYALVEQRRYASANAETVLAEFELARNKTLELILGLRPDELQRTGHFEGYGRLTVRGLVHFLCSHDQQHLSGLQWLLGKVQSARTDADRN